VRHCDRHIKREGLGGRGMVVDTKELENIGILNAH
jgi:hypothetical protein